MDNNLKLLLDRHAEMINTPAFISGDPVQFPRQFSSLQDIEITALLVSTIAWGRRDMICRNATRLIDVTLHGSPFGFLMSQEYESLPSRVNIHRTFFTDNLIHYLRGLHQIYARYGSLAAYARSIDIASRELPSFHLAEGICRAITEANDGQPDSRCLPTNLSSTPLKRLNMALRWLTRRDGIVDLGVWDDSVLSPSRLIIPLDVHVGRVSRQLGLLRRTSDDRRAALELTEALRRFNPDDPIIYDFALFGIGVNGLEIPKAGDTGSVSAPASPAISI
ncbi:MAG: TIGR02757 family protein [Pseudoflavonifractor sp.]|nr:TIGR02757 family protein [Alloprevotella sp.]MCM1117171.1 TIGR02757 family protein [Pseudoflavonifractor sp.]